MNAAALVAIGCLLVAQAPDPEKYKPKFEDRPGAEAPATNAFEERSNPATTRSDPATTRSGPANTRNNPAAAERDPAAKPSQPNAFDVAPPDTPSLDFGEPSAASPPARGAPTGGTAPPRETPPGSGVRTPTGPMSRVGTATVRLRPPELLAEALSKTQQGDLRGEPLSLTKALSQSTDRAQQIAIAQAYWRLATAQASYFFARDERNRLRQVTADQLSQPAVASARASARATIREAELEVLASQSGLAEKLGGAQPQLGVLTIDRPHVGAYETQFAAIYSGRAAPPRHRLIDRSLPVCRKAIDVHAAAIVAALDAWQATAEEYAGARTDLSTLTACLGRLSGQRRAFLAAVYRYNRDIAEYTLAVPGAQRVPEARLAALLIRDPAPADAATQTGAPGTGTPPAAASPDAAPTGSTSPREPRAFNPSSAPGASALDADDEADDGTVPSTFLETPRASRPRGGAAPATREQPAAPPSAPQSQIRNRPEGVVQAGALEDAGLYQGLVSAKTDVRVARLVELLHWDRNVPKEFGDPLPLEKSLVVATSLRPRMLRAYWRAREELARYQALQDGADQLKNLAGAALESSSRGGVAAAMLRIQGVRQAERAAAVDAQLGVLDSQFEIMTLLGSPLEGRWSLPSTRPSAGPGASASAPSTRVNEPPAVRRGRVAYYALKRRASTLVMADRARALATSEAMREPARLDAALNLAAIQMDETFAFLKSVTAYNLAVAERPATSVLSGANPRFESRPPQGSL